MTRTDRLLIQYFFIVYFAFAALAFSGIYQFSYSAALDIFALTFFFITIVPLIILPYISLIAYIRGKRFEIYMWILSVIIFFSYFEEVEYDYFGTNAIFSASSLFQPSINKVLEDTIFFLSSIINIIFLTVRRNVLKSPSTC